MDWQEPENFHTLHITTIDSLNDVISKYQEILEQEVRCSRRVKLFLKLSENSQRAFHKETTSYALP